MGKKAVAVFCVVVLMMSVLVACGKTKGPTIVHRGIEYPLATDDKGSTIVDESGYIAAYITNAKGKYAEDSDGDRFTTWVNFPNRLITDNKLENAEFVISAPEGWTFEATGQNLAKNADGNMEFDVTRINAHSKTLKEYYEESIVQTKEMIKYFEKDNYTVDFSTGDCTLGAEKYAANCMVCDFYCEKGDVKVDSRVIMMYYEYEGRIYKALYQSNNTEKYSLEKAAQLFDGLVMKHYVEPESTTK